MDILRAKKSHVPRVPAPVKPPRVTSAQIVQSDGSEVAGALGLGPGATTADSSSSNSASTAGANATGMPVPIPVYAQATAHPFPASLSVPPGAGIPQSGAGVPPGSMQMQVPTMPVATPPQAQHANGSTNAHGRQGEAVSSDQIAQIAAVCVAAAPSQLQGTPALVPAPAPSPQQQTQTPAGRRPGLTLVPAAFHGPGSGQPSSSDSSDSSSPDSSDSSSSGDEDEEIAAVEGAVRVGKANAPVRAGTNPRAATVVTQNKNQVQRQNQSQSQMQTRKWVPPTVAAATAAATREESSDDSDEDSDEETSDSD